MRPRTPRSILAVSLAASLAIASACSGDDAGSGPGAMDPTPTSPTDPDVTTTEPADSLDGDDGATTTGPTTTTGTTTDDTTTDDTTTDDGATGDTTSATTDPGDDTTPDQADPRFDILQPRVGTWVVGDAGEVDVDLTADGLVLLDVRAAEGWRVSIDEEAPDEIEVDFEQGAVEWEIEIEWENGILEVEIDQDIEPAEAGVVMAGIAGSVEFDVDSNGLVLVDFTTEEGWDAAVTEESADEIEVRFVNGLAEYDVEIELDDGQIEIEVDFEVEGPFTP